MKRFTTLAGLFILLLLVPPLAAFGPAISSVSPVSGPNNGVVTITLSGTDLDTATLVRLNKCRLATGGSSEPPFAGTIISKSATSLTARFDLTGKIPGNYDVSVSGPYEGLEVWGVASGAFYIYQGSGQQYTATTTVVPVKTVVTTTTVPPGKNSVYFETFPPGATIFLDGEEIGTSPFTYYTNRKGTFEVLVRKEGYEKYWATVVILEGKNVHFVAPLSVLATTATTVATTPPATTAATTGPTTAATAITTATPGMTVTTPGMTATASGRTQIPIPTPWPTDTPAAQHATAIPAIAPAAAALAVVLFVLRRRQDPD